MLTSIKQRIDREDEGFTLIELMVVLLIIAILLAIAIPTFLGARNTANARSSQENLRNALTAEQSNWTSNQSFDTALSTLEPSLSWVTANLTAATDKGAKEVSVGLYTATVASGAITAWGAGTSTTADGVVLVAWAKDNNCYAIFQSNNASADFTAYSKWSSGGTGCTDPTTSFPFSNPTAAGPTTVPATYAAGQWYTSF